MIPRAAILVLLLVLPACAVKWVQDGKTESQIKTDFQDCQLEAKLRYPANNYFFVDAADLSAVSCMKERGYRSEWAD